MFSEAQKKSASEQYDFASGAIDGELFVVLGRRPGAVVRGGFGGLHLDQHVSAFMFDRLKGPDRTSELVAAFGIFNRHLETFLGASDLFGGESDDCLFQHPLDHTPSLSQSAHQ